MKKVIIPAAALIMLAACDNMKKDSGEASNSNWPTLTDTIIYPSVNDPRKLDTLLLTSGVDTTIAARIDTIMSPGANPPYDLEMTTVKVGARLDGRKIYISKY